MDFVYDCSAKMVKRLILRMVTQYESPDRLAIKAYPQTGIYGNVSGDAVWLMKRSWFSYYGMARYFEGKITQMENGSTKITGRFRFAKTVSLFVTVFFVFLLGIVWTLWMSFTAKYILYYICWIGLILLVGFIPTLLIFRREERCVIEFLARDLKEQVDRECNLDGIIDIRDK